ncbi:MAG: DUF5615 family PIN-like protein [Isosphaerales bacterium]
MPNQVRFHLDEHVPPAIAAGLRRRGIDVTTTSDAGLAGADDIDHIASPDNCVLVTGNAFPGKHGGSPYADTFFSKPSSNSALTAKSARSPTLLVSSRSRTTPNPAVDVLIV